MIHKHINSDSFYLKIKIIDLLINLVKRYTDSVRFITNSFFLVALILLPLEQTAQSSFELICRGGGTMYFNYTPFSYFAAQPQIWITFERSPQIIGYNWEFKSYLMPGQCSCKDRLIYNNEPNRLLIKININDFSISWTQGMVAGISSSLTYINTLQDPKKFQSFTVYNDGRGNFVVTGIGYSGY
jgi:hypothetical protein